jgi:hypothetical protein
MSGKSMSIVTGSAPLPTSEVPIAFERNALAVLSPLGLHTATESKGHLGSQPSAVPSVFGPKRGLVARPHYRDRPLTSALQ